MNWSAVNSPERRSPRMAGRIAPLISEFYLKELELVIAQVWMTSEEQSQTVDDSIVIGAHLEEDEGVVWRVEDKAKGTCLAAALRDYSGTEIALA
jgi:hypothetical protein